MRKYVGQIVLNLLALHALEVAIRWVRKTHG